MKANNGPLFDWVSWERVATRESYILCQVTWTNESGRAKGGFQS